jgi:hypothetical protein
MKRLAALVCAIGLLAGCKNQMSSVNWLAPYGSTRVPPPGTNAHRGATPYYNGVAPASTATPVLPGSPVAPAGGTVTNPATIRGAATTIDPANAVPLANNWQPVGTGVQAVAAEPVGATTGFESAVQPASFTTPISDGKPTGATATSVSGLRLNGMRLNDATGVSPATDAVEPAPFQPAANASNLIPASVDFTTAGSATAAANHGVVRVTAKASDKFQSVVDRLVPSNASTLNWKSRYAEATSPTAPAVR